MKYTVLVIICLFSTMVLLAQKKDWKEMQDFHELMLQTFHPAENGDLQPTKDHIDELVQKAKAWKTSTVPVGYKAKLIKPALDKLVAECVSIKETITEKKSDEGLQKMISSAHNTFHEIMEKCKK